jgi:hypothetical protein
MSYPEAEHSMTLDEQCLSEVSSAVDEHFPVTEITIKKDIHKWLSLLVLIEDLTRI